MNDDELLALPAAALAAAIAARQTSATRAMRAVLDRAHRVQPALNAFVRIDDEAALAAAERADHALAAGGPVGPLHGVPMAHKDMYDRQGVACGWGSRIGGSVAATSTATVLQRLDAAGAIPFGVLNMAEFAFGPTGHNTHLGHCRNAWNPSRITGGSSSGSGTSVAARANWAALGSDTGGSIRLPAHFCGVVGLKPTTGRVSRAGAMPLSFSMDTVGPLTRTVGDCALLMRIIAGADPRDGTCVGRAVPDYVAECSRPVAGLRIGRPRGYFDEGCDRQVEAVLQASLERFADLGAIVVDVDLPDLTAWNAAGSLVISAEAAAVHRVWLQERPGDYTPQVRARLESGLVVPAAAYIDALRLRGIALEAFSAAVFDRVDVLHAPVFDGPTPTIAETDVGVGPNWGEVLARILRLTRPVNYLGLPALSVPAGFTDDGMPVGMQLIGRPFDESTLFALGAAYERSAALHARRPSAV